MFDSGALVTNENARRARERAKSVRKRPLNEILMLEKLRLHIFEPCLRARETGACPCILGSEIFDARPWGPDPTYGNATLQLQPAGTHETRLARGSVDARAALYHRIVQAIGCLARHFRGPATIGHHLVLASHVFQDAPYFV